MACIHSPFRVLVGFNLDAHIPLDNPNRPILFGDLSLAMYLALNPPGLNSGTIPENQHAIAMFLIQLIISLEMLSVLPLELPIPVHHIVLPFAVVVSVVVVGKFALALQTVLVELTEIGSAVGPLELAIYFKAVVEFASKDCAVLPELLALTVLLVVFP